MSGTKKSTPFRTSFEILEKRELMAADVSLSLNAFLASTSAISRIASRSVKIPAVQPVAPVTPAAPVTPTAPSTPSSPGVVDWFSLNLNDVALRDLTRASASDGSLSRTDMLNVFSQVRKDNVVSSNEFNDLKKLVQNNSLFGTNEYVQVLSSDVVLGNKANAKFQGQVMGNLVSGSSAAHLDKLVGKWLLGQDRPTTMAGATYKQAAGTLFPHTAAFSDVVQGGVGDCYYLSSLAECAVRNPSWITNMFIVNGDGTYTVRFYNNGKADYVTVDSQLPVNSRGSFVYANMGQSISSNTVPLWVALAEKAYAQMNESGWLRAQFGDSGSNSYEAISGGYMTDALKQITNVNTAYAAVDKNSFIAAYNRGCLITFGSYSNPNDGVVGNHGYAVLGYNATTQQVTLFNPWGVNNRYAPGIVTLNFAQLQTNFFAMEYTV